MPKACSDPLKGLSTEATPKLMPLGGPYPERPRVSRRRLFLADQDSPGRVYGLYTFIGIIVV